MSARGRSSSFAVLLIAGAALGDRFGRRRLYAVGLGLFAVASAAGALAPDVGTLSRRAVGQDRRAAADGHRPVAAGDRHGVAIPAAQNSVVGSVGADAVGKAAGANSMMRELGGVFGIAIAVAVFAAAGSYASPAGRSAPIPAVPALEAAN